MGLHDMGRAVLEGADLNEWLSLTPPFSNQLLARAASFCTERSGHFEAWDLTDQGMAFFLPNMTWLQPPAHVHAMISRGGPWPTGLSTTITAGRGGALAPPPPCPMKPCPSHPGRKFCPSIAAPHQCDQTTPVAVCPPCHSAPPKYGPVRDSPNINCPSPFAPTYLMDWLLSFTRSLPLVVAQLVMCACVRARARAGHGTFQSDQLSSNQWLARCDPPLKPQQNTAHRHRQHYQARPPRGPGSGVNALRATT